MAVSQVYKLQCADCGLFVFVVSQWANTEFVCPYCGLATSAGVCVDTEGNIETDPSQCQSLVGTDPANFPGAVTGTEA